MAETPQTTELAAGFAAVGEDAWRALVDKLLKGADFDRRLVTRSADGLAIGPLYSRRHGGGAGAHEAPGMAPFTRGLRAASGGEGRWQIRQILACGDATTLRSSIEEELGGGADSVVVRVAGPGQVGVPVSALAGVLADLPAGSVHLEPGAMAIEAAAAVAGCSAIAGLGIDPVGTLARTGERFLLADDNAGFKAAPPWLAAPGVTLLADGRPFHEAGGSEAQELAGMLGALVACLRGAEAGGVAPAEALARIELALAADGDLFLTITKLRAARRLAWQVAEACGAGYRVQRLRLVATTSERMMSRRDPWVNMLRTTAAAAAAAIGGADAIGVRPFTWPLGQPDGFARRIARNTHHVLGEESGLARVADPAGGAWAVERLTEELAQKAWSLFQDWEARGGIARALTSGMVGRQIGEVAAARATAIATGKLSLTGTSAFPRLGDDGVSVEPWPAAAACRGALLAPVRFGETFERLRDAADNAPARPQVFLVTLGTPAEHATRATWVVNLLAAGGVEAIVGEGFPASADAGRAFAESGLNIACICGTDEAYDLQGEAVAGVLKQAGAQRVYLAGRPGNAAQLKAAGVDGFWFSGADMIESLRELHGALGL